MQRPILTPSQAALLRKLALRYQGAAKQSQPWYRRTADELWRKTFSAIAAQGNARAAFVIENSFEAQRQTSLARLKSFRTDPERLKHIHWVLSTVKARYIRQNFRRDPKSKAALQNFHILTKPGGPKQFFSRIAKITSEARRIDSLRKLAYYGPKTARDTAIELGLAENCLALDIRLKALLKAVGASTQGFRYEQIENAVIQGVARHGLSGAQLDRLLFQNYDKILADIRLSRAPR